MVQRPLRSSERSSRAVQFAYARVVCRRVHRAHAGAGAGLAGHRLGRARPDLGADRIREDAGRVPVGDRSVVGGRRARPHRPRLRLAAEGALLRHRPQPARPATRHRRRPEGRRPHWRHAAARAPGDAARAAGHPDHHARVALPDADRPRPGAVRRRGVVHRGRDPRGGVDQARRAPGPDPGAVDRGGRARGAADRPVRDPEAARGDRPLPGRAAPHVPHRRHRRAQGARPGDPSSRRFDGGTRADADARPRSARGRHRGDPPLDLARDLSRAARADRRPPLDDPVRQQPAREPSVSRCG